MDRLKTGTGLARVVDRARKRLMAALLIVGPALIITIVFVLAPKADTPRHEALPEGNLTALAFGDIDDGDADHRAAGNVTLYANGTGHFLYFQGYDARSGPNVWFFLVTDADADSAESVEDDGVRLRVPGPGQATYRDAFVVPVPQDVDVTAFGAVVAWDVTLNERFAVAALDPL